MKKIVGAILGAILTFLVCGGLNFLYGYIDA